MTTVVKIFVEGPDDHLVSVLTRDLLDGVPADVQYEDRIEPGMGAAFILANDMQFELRELSVNNLPDMVAASGRGRATNLQDEAAALVGGGDPADTVEAKEGEVSETETEDPVDPPSDVN